MISNVKKLEQILKQFGGKSLVIVKDDAGNHYNITRFERDAKALILRIQKPPPQNPNEPL